MAGREGDLPLQPPAVSPDEYDDDYFRSCCAGAAEWAASDGRKVAGIYPGVLKQAGFRAGEVVVDIGTGRGELPVVAALWGAREAVGVEYSAAAVALAEQTAAAHDVADKARYVLADARATPLPDDYADLVTLVDVVEHLTPAELDHAFVECRRILRPGGRLFVHTFPTATTYEVTYRLLRAVTFQRSWPRDPRNDYEHRMHVNEQTLRGLRDSLRRAGFSDVDVRMGQWVHVEHLTEPWAQRTVRTLARVRPLSRLFIADLVATAYKPTT
jgi:ubiquinone/menaquinone biosynthesis C-methylase UbiE